MSHLVRSLFFIESHFDRKLFDVAYMIIIVLQHFFEFIVNLDQV